MHQNCCRLGLRPRPCWGSLQRSPRPPSCVGLGWRFFYVPPVTKSWLRAWSHVYWAYNYLSPFGVLWVHMARHKNCVKKREQMNKRMNDRSKWISCSTGPTHAYTDNEQEFWRTVKVKNLSSSSSSSPSSVSSRFGFLIFDGIGETSPPPWFDFSTVFFSAASTHSSVRRSRPGQAQILTSTDCRPCISPSFSSVKITWTGLRPRPPTHELKHMNW